MVDVWREHSDPELQLRSGGEHSDPELAVEERSDPELAVEARRGTLQSRACS